MFSSQAYPAAALDAAPRRPGRGGARAPAPIALLLALALLAAPLAACSGDTVRTLAVDAGYGPKAVAAPDFVAQSRTREAPDFMNVGIDAPRRPARAKSAEGQKALEAELEGARGRNEARGRSAESAGRGTGKGTAKATGKATATAAKPAPASTEAD